MFFFFAVQELAFKTLKNFCFSAIDRKAAEFCLYQTFEPLTTSLYIFFNAHLKAPHFVVSVLLVQIKVVQCSKRKFHLRKLEQYFK